MFNKHYGSNMDVAQTLVYRHAPISLFAQYIFINR